MKWVILMFLVLGAWFITKETETTVEIQSEEGVIVSWLRDGQDGEKNSAVQVGSFFVTKRNTVYGEKNESRIRYQDNSKRFI